ncbi:VOC family protein [Streptomyces cremeus]|uniref:VOC family protein n=1 Tax=Streptomyces cremeus TaxID=66881 RepID=A0ABV5P6K7_STRCM
MTEAAARHTPGTPCWVSLMVHQLPTTQQFYGALFGWEFRPGPQELGPYVRALLDGRDIAGLGRLPPDRHLTTAWTPYLATEDATASAQAVSSSGGTVAVGPLQAGEAGRLAIVADPAGAVFGLWQAAEHLGTGLAGVPGTPVWNELVTRETAGIVKFYQAVFGYGAEAVVSADFDFTTLLLDGKPVASLHGVGHALPRERGAHWMTYFEVEDTDEAAALVRDLGGYVLQPPRESTIGRTAVVADPEGAVFTVVRSHR